MSAQYQGFIWEKGLCSGCVFLFPANSDQYICIGSEWIDGPQLLIKCHSYVYFDVFSARNGNPHDYLVITDFLGPFRPAHSGDRFEFEEQTFRLL